MKFRWFHYYHQEPRAKNLMDMLYKEEREKNAKKRAGKPKKSVEEKNKNLQIIRKW